MKADKIDFWSRPNPAILSPDSTQIRESLTNALTWPSPVLHYYEPTFLNFKWREKSDVRPQNGKMGWRDVRDV